jgi:hypothetical protein
VSITDRDRKIILALVPLLFVAAFWFLLVAPQREQATAVGDQLTSQEELRDAAELQAAQLTTTKADFAVEYAEVVRLGKAIPSSVDMPSLLVQLEQAAKGTGIGFEKISAGPRVAGTPATEAAPTTGQPTDAGGTPAQSGPGQAVETANDTAADAEAANADHGDTSTSTTVKDGGLPVGGGAASASITPGAPVPGLDTVTLDMEFSGQFFDLASFFHRLKRFVRVANDRINVHGRLLTVDSLTFRSPEEAGKPALTASIKATIYLVPTAIEATVPNGAGSAPVSGTASNDDRGGPPLATVAR